ncbi:MAG: hypothetical protein IJT56_09390 [Clostridia bacterium]|nr:hypothetical protein [Clostridia bacterium]
MDIKKMKFTSFLGRLDDPEKMRLISQHGLRHHSRAEMDGLEAGYSSCWDMICSPYDGKMYFAPTWEKPGHHTRLVEYDFDSDSFAVRWKAEELLLPYEKQEPHSKLHTSINFLPDGSIIATTHNTAGAPGHPEWMPLAHIDHAWEGFPGSYIIHFDPKTGKCENLGLPAIRESIYGSCYDPKYNALYMIGFTRGHVYRYGLDDKSVKDLGKAAEIFNYRLHLGPDGHIYSMNKAGYLYRVNVDTQKLEGLEWVSPFYPDSYQNNTHYRYMSQACNISDHEFVFVDSTGWDLFRFDCITKKVEALGKRSPFDQTSDLGRSPMGLDEIAIDSEGVLWYALNGPQQEMPEPDENGNCDFYHFPSPQFLIRWDLKSGRGPENMGIIGTPDWDSPTAYCFCCDTVHDILYMIGGGHGPRAGGERDLGVFVIDLREFRKHMYDKGPALDLKAVPYTPEETERAKNYVRAEGGEEVSVNNPTTTFPMNVISPVRLWRSLPGDITEKSKVRKLAWDTDGSLWGLSGDGEDEYLFRIVYTPYSVYPSREAAESDGKYFCIRSIMGRRLPRTFEENGSFYVENPSAFLWSLDSLTPISASDAERVAFVREKGLPGEIAELPEGISLPSVIGRRYLAVPTATAPWSRGRIAVGTGDALFAVVDGEHVFSYGSAASLGPVRCMTVNAARTKLWGVAGYKDSVSTIFSFDETDGLKQLAILTYNSAGGFDGQTAANLLTSIALSPDEKYLAVGGGDRLGSVHVMKIG